MGFLGDAFRFVGKALSNVRQWVGKKIIDPVVDKLGQIPGVKDFYNHTLKSYYDTLKDKYGQFEEVFTSGGDVSKVGGFFMTSRIIEKIIDKLRGKGVSSKEIIDALKNDVNGIQTGLSLFGGGSTAARISSGISNAQEVGDIASDIYEAVGSSKSSSSSSSHPRPFIAPRSINYNRPLPVINGIARPSIQITPTYDTTRSSVSDEVVFTQPPTTIIPRMVDTSRGSASDRYSSTPVSITIPRLDFTRQ
jgi:hypothetical protein